MAAALALAPASASAADTPTASFTTSPASPVVGQTVTFDGSASNDTDGDPITQWQWKFGDGDTQNTTTPETTHIYAKPGTYTALLTVIDSQNNASANVSQQVVVLKPDTAPVAKFKVTPGSPQVGQVAVFDASKSSDGDGDTIASYHWTFGDGVSQTTTTATVSHTYASSGTFTPTLVVIDSRGTSSTAVSHAVTVKAALPPVLPVAHLTISPANPAPGEFVLFYGGGSNGNGHAISKYLWSFGDGASTSTKSAFVYHAYKHPGTYTATLIVATSKSTFSTPSSIKVVVSNAPSGPPAASKLRAKVCRHRSSRCPVRGLRITFRLPRDVTVTVSLVRPGHRRVLKQVVIAGRAGRNVVSFRFRGRPGRHYRVLARPSGGKAAIFGFAWPGR